MDALLVIDNPHRELRGMTCVKRLLAERGIKARIISKIAVEEAFRLYGPAVVLLPRVTTDMAVFARSASKIADIVVVPSEHGSGFREKVILNGLNIRPDGSRQGDAAPEAVKKIYVGGPNQAQWLIESGAYDGSRVVVAGTLNSDHWMMALNKRAGQIGGVATSFKSMIMGMSFTSVPELVELHRGRDWRDDIWRAKLLAFEVAYMFVLLDALQRLRDLKKRVSIRPHPHEYANGWKTFARKMGPFTLFDRSIRLDHWLDGVSFTISSFSTLGIDSIARGVPAISLDRLVPEEFYSALPSQKMPLMSPYAWRPETPDEMVSLFSKAFAGELPCSPDMPAAARFMNDNFYFPRDRLAADIIAEDIAHLVSQRKRNSPSTGKRSPLRMLANLAVYAKRAARDIKNYLFLPRSENLYYFFSFRLRRDALRYANDLLGNRDRLRTGADLKAYL